MFQIAFQEYYTSMQCYQLSEYDSLPGHRNGVINDSVDKTDLFAIFNTLALILP